MNTQLVTIATFSHPHEAHIARARLEADGIPAFIADEHTVNMYWLFSNAVGGVRLQVPESDSQRALEILSRDDSDLLDDMTGTDETRCPYCDSDEVVPHTLGRQPAFVVFLLLGFPLFFYRHGIKCRACGHFSPL